MRHQKFCSTALLLTALSSLASQAGDFTAAILNGDTDSGINPALIYTAKVDYNGGTTINGVAFTDSGTTGTGYALTGTGGVFSGYGNSVGGALNGAISNFVYTGDNTGNASLTLGDLTPGTPYITSFYNASFGGNRYVDITPSDTGTTFRYNEDANVSGGGSVLRYAFTATASTLTLNFDAVSNGDSFHHYVLTNAVRNDALFSYTHFAPLTPVVTAANGNAPFTPSNTDLLQTNLSGIVTTGNLSREGVLGAPAVLANGTFSITGVSANNPELITGENNSSVTFDLDTSVNPQGYDVTSIASFGGWNDGGRDHQRYSLFFSTVGSDDFTLYGQLDTNPIAAGSPSAVQAVFTGLATNVDAVKVVFLDGVENGYTGYGEFDVNGTASVPEPTATSVMALTGLGLLLRRRR